MLGAIDGLLLVIVDLLWLTPRGTRTEDVGREIESPGRFAAGQIACNRDA